MASIADLVHMLGQPPKVFWQGGVPDVVIAELERQLDVRLPSSFRSFLRQCGGGGVIGQEISGVEDSDASIGNRGTVLGDTRARREQYDLSKQYVVIYLTDDDVVWCLDTSAFEGTECPVMAFNTVTKTAALLFSSFHGFLADYVSLRTERGTRGE